ncbi:hypothetical protein GGR52DRAFT_558618 [Hypoxylon sp. FL1284]|nr:hypothetical protein GGR52DRAFT_558618 [Hypoxylon sp. FL1284]
MAPIASASASSPKPEYQHFVPQFILRNYAHKYTGPKQQRGKKKADKMFRGELVVNNVNLASDPICIEETKVKRILGIYDMYQDTSAPTAQQRRIESMFGELESRASIIFRKITKAYDAKEQGVWVTRDERNAIRKFLFLLKYRNSTFHRRFYHDSEDGYEANDKEHVHEYMRENGFKRPVDVWFHNIKTIMELDMDPQGLWIRALLGKMYPADAMWFISHTQMMYMAICTPSDARAEFILTDNSYGIFEGPNTFKRDEETGEIAETGWTSFHEFAPLSPKLMVVLRSFMLPNPEEDGSQSVREEREAWRKAAVDDYYGSDQTSLLADLPIAKPRNNYSQVVNGRVELLPGEDGKLRKSDKFCFRFFPIDTEHVNKINHFLFDNAYKCKNIVFGDKNIFKKTLEWYMTVPPVYGKCVTMDAAEQRRKLLENLAALMTELGSTKKPIWTEIPDETLSEGDRMKVLLQGAMQVVSHMIENNTNRAANSGIGFMYIYECLGGSAKTLLKDLEQAQRMLTLRIKIDVWSKGIPEPIREQARIWLGDIYVEGCPSRRILLYLKRIRAMILWHDKEGHTMQEAGKDSSVLDGPEDTIAEAAHNLTTRTRLSRLMYRTAMNDIEMAQQLDFDLWGKAPRGIEGAWQLALVGKIVLGIPGDLKECGIAEIEGLAVAQEKVVRDQGLHRMNAFHNDFFEDDEKIEVVTRVMVKPHCQRVLGGRMKADLGRRFEKVLFEVTYPTPPVKRRA